MEQFDNTSLFQLLALSLGNAALIALGFISDPSEGAESKKPTIRLEDARHNIDLLEMLEEKTRRNLTEEERQLLQSLLFDLRMKFVEASRHA
jgi:hypothetical protein